MFSSALLGSVQSSDAGATKHFHILQKIIQNQTLVHRPRLARQYLSSSPENPNVHTCHYISFREIYNHILNTVISQDDGGDSSKEIQKRLTQYLSTMFRSRSTNCSRAIIMFVYFVYTFDKYYCDKDRLPVLSLWVANKKLSEVIKNFWMYLYNHSGNFAKNGHPRTNLMIRSRRDLVYTNGNICEHVHGKLGQKWNKQLQSMKKNTSPAYFNLPVIPSQFIGTKYSGVYDGNGKEQIDNEKVKDMCEHGWFILSSHCATSPRYRLPLSDIHKDYPEELDQGYYRRDNDNFDVKVSTRVNELDIHPDNMTEDDRTIFKTLVKEVLAKERESNIGKQNFSGIDCNDMPLNNDMEEMMPPINDTQRYVYAGYVFKQQIHGSKSSSLSFSFGQ